MYILTNRLVGLNHTALPLPWYHRASLGLMSGAPVHVALQEPGTRPRPFGDLLVSMVDPINWPHVNEVVASRRTDKPGVLAEVYKAAPPLNIVFAEAVTVDSGSRHDAHLVLEPFQSLETEAAIAAQVDEGIAGIKAALRNFRKGVRPLHATRETYAWMDVGTVEQGMLHVEGWREALARQAKRRAPLTDAYDIDRAVIWADTNRRMLRYVFPRKGAVSVSVQHSDRPGAMGQIAAALAVRNLNILSWLLRRGSAPAYKAEVVFVVEPALTSTERTSVAADVKAALEGLPAELRVRIQVEEGPADPQGVVLYPRRPHEIAVQPSKPMQAMILAVKETFPADRIPVFISRQFSDDGDAEKRQVVAELRRVLLANGYEPVEAIPQPGAETGASDEVKARMWASEAAILLVMSSTLPEREFSVNLAHECGFMQGQGKPLLPLVETEVSPRIAQYANLQGLQQITFDRAAARNGDEAHSVQQTALAWLNRLFAEQPDAA